MRLAILILIVLSVPALATSATLKVPSQYPNIQDAINASVNGDTVLVSPGTYVENIDFKSKAITITSTGGANVTIIDGNQAESVVRCWSGEGPNSVLEGFTLTNGTGTHVGGGLFYGGGMCNKNSSPTVTNCIFSGNSTGWGGGICCWGSSSTISNTTITGNTADAWGGGIFCENSSLTITNTTITGNTADAWGGGICSFSGSSPTITNTTITGNTADDGGGIFCCNYSSPTIMNTTITGNTADGSGGGIDCFDHSSPRIKNTTITGNTADDGGGISCSHNSSPTIMNSILWDNTAATGMEIRIGANTYSSTLTISYSDVEGGQSSVHMDPGCTLNWGAGMIDADPILVAGPHGFYYLSQIASGQSSNSPCVDSGSDLASNLGMDIYWTRTDEVPDSGIVDMGFHYGNFLFPALQTDTFSIQENTGGDADFLLLAGTGNANRNYILLGSVTGTDPGMPLPGGIATLPLNYDAFTTLVISLINTPVFSNFMGTLDGTGSASATFDTLAPIPGAAGLTLHFAYALNNPWDFASNPVGIEILP